MGYLFTRGGREQTYCGSRKHAQSVYQWQLGTRPEGASGHVPSRGSGWSSEGLSVSCSCRKEPLCHPSETAFLRSLFCAIYLMPFPARSTMSRRSLITYSYKVVKGKNDGRKRARIEEKVQEPGGDKGLLRNITVVSTPEVERALQRLREFDLEWRYGPCTGITRLERWERAELLGLQPPKSVKDLVLQHKDDPRFVNNLWSDYPL